MTTLEPDEVLGIVCHVSASTWGNKEEIDLWHRKKGWAGIGYHGVITNGVIENHYTYDISQDGLIQPGRSEDVMGAHCLAKGMNTCSIGVCCIGNPGWPPEGAELAPKEFIQGGRKYLTKRQLLSLVNWLAENCKQYGLNPLETFERPGDGKSVYVISQHSDHDPVNKPFCASLVLPPLRQLVAERLKEI